MPALSENGVNLVNLASDTLVAAYLAGEKSLDIRSLGLYLLDIDIGIQDSTSKLKEELPAGEKISTTARNICLQTDITGRLNDKLAEKLQRQELWKLYTEIEIPLIPILARMEKNGITLDTKVMQKISQDMGEQLRHVEQEIYTQTGHKFNINSPHQLSIVLFKELKLPPSRKTKKGYSTNA
jgi:DNA polymerase-1